MQTGCNVNSISYSIPLLPNHSFLLFYFLLMSSELKQSFPLYIVKAVHFRPRSSFLLELIKLWLARYWLWSGFKLSVNFITQNYIIICISSPWCFHECPHILPVIPTGGLHINYSNKSSKDYQKFINFHWNQWGRVNLFLSC